MPPTSPAGMPCVAIVFARLIAGEGEDRGIQPVLVPIHDGETMYAGVSTKYVLRVLLVKMSIHCSALPRNLPPRGGSRPLNHALTYFYQVRLPSCSLLGSPERSADPKKTFFDNISRVAVGTIAIGSLGVPALQVAAYIAAQYSWRRTVIDQNGAQRPIISFRTQHAPIVTALAQAKVLKAFHVGCVKIFLSPRTPESSRTAIAVILKVVMMQFGFKSLFELSDRCGAQGLFEANQISSMLVRNRFSLVVIAPTYRATKYDLRGTAIAEGDILVISISKFSYQESGCPILHASRTCN